LTVNLRNDGQLHVNNIIYTDTATAATT